VTVIDRRLEAMADKGGSWRLVRQYRTRRT
jgi:hypothetical protein